MRKAKAESERARRELATARRELIQLRTDNEQLHAALVGSLDPLEAAKVVAFRRMQAALDAPNPSPNPIQVGVDPTKMGIGPVPATKVLRGWG